MSASSLTPRPRLAGRSGFRKLAVMCACVSMLLFLIGLWQDWLWLRALSKPWIHLALLTFLWPAPRRSLARVMGVGLLLGGVGDLLLEFRQTLFLPGMIVFMLGHIAYILGFIRHCRTPRLILTIPFTIWVVVMLVHLWGGLGAMTVPVVLYSGVLGTMMWRAAAAAGGPGRGSAAWAGLLGAVIFGLSDSLIALDRFGDAIAHVRYPIILTYWLAQGLITFWTLQHEGRLEA